MKLQHSLSWLIVASLIGLSGCNLLAHVAYLSGGTMVPAQYNGFEASRVAVVCVSDNASYGSGTESQRLARGIAMILHEQVPDIEVVHSSEIEDWIDRKGWDEIDYREVGRGVKADHVLAVDLSGFRVRDGASLFKGRADLTITVFDMTADGREVFRKDITEFSYPTTGPYHATDTTEAKFSKHFLKVLAKEVAKHFHEYDMIDEFGTPSHIGG